MSKGPLGSDEQLQPLAESSQQESQRLAAPGMNLPPQLQAEGEAYVNELLEYLLQDISSEGLDHLINRSARR